MFIENTGQKYSEMLKLQREDEDVHEALDRGTPLVHARALPKDE